MNRILIIDDDRTVCASLKLLLKKSGYEVDAIHGPQQAETHIGTFRPSVILLDMNFTIDTSGKQGLRLLKQIRRLFPDISVLLMTGWATVQLAVEGMKIGAKDFKAKPWDNKDILQSIQNILSLYHEDDHALTLKNDNKEKSIIGSSDAIKNLLEMAQRVAVTDASVLITGESGTGKELIAETIHQNSARADQSFVKVNLGGLPSTLFESELFGHKKGAFTGAHSDRIGRFTLANTGTIFLDEIGEVELTNQVKLLRVLQERSFEPLGSSLPEHVDVRVISATNRNLENMCVDQTFREDLYYRINLIHLKVPPLRDRRSDIPELVQYFINNISLIYDTDKPSIDDRTFEWLSQQEYKGNIRQLKNIVERTYLLNLKESRLSIDHFLPSFNTRALSNDKESALNLRSQEIRTIEKALALHDHSISQTARALGITRSSLYRRLEKYNIVHEPKI